MQRVGVSYNIFDGEELLRGSIDSIREHVDYVCLVYQDVSNFGRPNKVPLAPFLETLGADEVIQYQPKHFAGHANEIAKRQIGMDACARAGCDVFMTMDCDEYYDQVQFAIAKSTFVEGGYDSSACMMQTYYKYPDQALSPSESYYVPFMYKVDARQFKMGLKWPVVADPTRKLEPGKMLLFDRDVLEMHHFSMCRSDIRSKLMNSSASVNFKDRIEEIARHHDLWEPGAKALMPGRERRLYDTVFVGNKFKIKIQ